MGAEEQVITLILCCANNSPLPLSIFLSNLFVWSQPPLFSSSIAVCPQRIAELLPIDQGNYRHKIYANKMAHQTSPPLSITPHLPMIHLIPYHHSLTHTLFSTTNAFVVMVTHQPATDDDKKFMPTTSYLSIGPVRSGPVRALISMHNTPSEWFRVAERSHKYR